MLTMLLSLVTLWREQQGLSAQLTVAQKLMLAATCINSIAEAMETIIQVGSSSTEYSAGPTSAGLFWYPR